MITHACHCRYCQTISGAPFRVVAMIETDRLKLIEGSVQWFDGGPSHLQVRCPNCGCTLWSHRPDLGKAIAFVGLGVLDEGEWFVPEAHYFVRSKHPWIALPASVPAFDTIGDPRTSRLRERVISALAGTGSSVHPSHNQE